LYEVVKYVAMTYRHVVGLQPAGASADCGSACRSDLQKIIDRNVGQVPSKAAA
jgi:hypothetical protein